ncbi:MAG: acyltransferase [Burkholderiaceae bacterium]|nr:acyltransferase [Burkholderiaceae bacterium]
MSKPVAPAAAQTNHAEQLYRPDIDGLRAFAVLAVVGFHAFPGIFPGGFVGVDVFFVISGYLITGIILKGRLAGNFSFAQFYARRIRRIFPALLTVLVAVLIAGYFLCFADEFANLGLHAAAGMFFLANISHWMAAGNYFASAADHQPLLHLWSLGIEEQFYLAWPLALLLLAKRPDSVLKGTLALLVLSFIFNIAGLQKHPVENFYLPFGRVWELLAGSALAARETSGKGKSWNSRFGSHTLSIAGAGFLLLALWGLDRKVPFPGFAALLPVAGAVCMMAAGPQAVLNHWLSRKIWVGIGIISFPLYLWHWPLLAFPRLIAGGEVSSAWRITSVLFSFLLAWLTYRFVEKKLRFHPWKNMPWLLLAVGSGIALLAGVAYHGEGWPQRFEFTRRNTQENDNVAWALNTPDCASRFEWKYDYCRYFSVDAPGQWVLFTGDSHAHALAKAFPESKNMGLVPNTGLLYFGKAGCTGWRWVRLSNWDCPSFDDLSAQAQKNRVKQIILFDRHAMYYEGTGFGVDLKEIQPWFFFRPPGQVPVDESKAAFAAALRATLDAWRVRGKEVVFVHQVPELGFNPAARNRPLAAYLGGTVGRDAILRAVVEARQRGYRQAVAEILKDYPQVRVFDPMDDFCDATYCHARKDGKLLYHDDDHMSHDGSQLLLKRLIEFLQKTDRANPD